MSSQPSAPSGTGSSDGFGNDFIDMVVQPFEKRYDFKNDAVMDEIEEPSPRDAARPPDAADLAAGFLAECTVSGRDCSSKMFSPSGRSASTAHSMSCGVP